MEKLLSLLVSSNLEYLVPIFLVLGLWFLPALLWRIQYDRNPEMRNRNYKHVPGWGLVDAGPKDDDAIRKEST